MQEMRALGQYSAEEQQYIHERILTLMAQVRPGVNPPPGLPSPSFICPIQLYETCEMGYLGHMHGWEVSHASATSTGTPQCVSAI